MRKKRTHIENMNAVRYGAPKGNMNAVGHGAPKGNKNALKHGGYINAETPRRQDAKVADISRIGKKERAAQDARYYRIRILYIMRAIRYCTEMGLEENIHAILRLEQALDKAQRGRAKAIRQMIECEKEESAAAESKGTAEVVELASDNETKVTDFRTHKMA